MYSIVNQGAKREYSWATRPMSNEEWRWEAPDLSVSYNCPSTYFVKQILIQVLRQGIDIKFPILFLKLIHEQVNLLNPTDH